MREEKSPPEKKPEDVEKVPRRDMGRDDLEEHELGSDKPPMPGWPTWKRPD